MKKNQILNTGYKILIGALCRLFASGSFFYRSRCDGSCELIGIRETLGELGTLASTSAEEVQLCAANFGNFLDLDLLDRRRVERKYALNTDAGSDLADGEIRVRRAVATVDADDESFENLGTIFITHLKLRVHTYGVARLDVGAVQKHLFCLFFESDSGHKAGAMYRPRGPV